MALYTMRLLHDSGAFSGHPAIHARGDSATEALKKAMSKLARDIVDPMPDQGGGITTFDDVGAIALHRFPWYPGKAPAFLLEGEEYQRALTEAAAPIEAEVAKREQGRAERRERRREERREDWSRQGTRTDWPGAAKPELSALDEASPKVADEPGHESPSL